MLLVKFCWIEKTCRYVGWTEYNNGKYYSSGENLDALLKNLIVSLRYRYGINEVPVLDSKPSPQSEMPVRIMTKRFLGANVLDKHRKKKSVVYSTGPKLLSREELEKSLIALNREEGGIEEVKKEEPKKMEVPEPSVDREFDYKIEEDENGKRLVVFELVKVAEWKLAK